MIFLEESMEIDACNPTPSSPQERISSSKFNTLYLVFFIFLYVGLCVFSVYAIISDYCLRSYFFGISLSTWAFLFPIMLMIIWSIILYKQSKKSILKLNNAADELYFLGYFGTVISMVALFFILSFFYNDFNHLKNISLIIRAVSVALAKTVIGLIGRFVFKGLSQEFPSHDYVEGEIKLNIESDAMKIKKSMKGLLSEINNATKTFSALTKNINNLSLNVKKIPIPLDKLNSVNKKLDLTLEKFNQIIKKLNVIKTFSISDGVKEDLRLGIESLARLTTKISEIEPKIKDMPGNMIKLEDIFIGCNSSLTQFNNEVKETKKILSDFAKLQKLGITKEMEHKELLIKEVKGLSLNICKLTERVDSLHNRINSHKTLRMNEIEINKEINNEKRINKKNFYK